MMGTTLFRIVILMLAALLALPGCEDPNAEEVAAIRASLRKLDEANRNCDGAAAVAVMSSRGLAEYDRVVRLALDATAAEVHELLPGEMWHVIQLRHRLTRRELEAMDGRAYQEYATGNCWYSFDDDEGSYDESIGAIHVSGDTAYGDILDERGRKSGVQAHFEREDGVWKLNEFSFDRYNDEVLLELAAEEGLPIAEYLVLWEELETGDPVPDSIWDPMR